MIENINEYLRTLKRCLDIVRLYFKAKMKNSNIPNFDATQDAASKTTRRMEPLFADMTVPTQNQVGFLLNLSCGHNRHPNAAESMVLTTHLDLAGFLEPVELDRNTDEVVSQFSSPTKPLVSAVKVQGTKSVTGEKLISKAEEEKKRTEDSVQEPDDSGNDRANKSSSRQEESKSESISRQDHVNIPVPAVEPNQVSAHSVELESSENHTSHNVAGPQRESLAAMLRSRDKEGDNSLRRKGEETKNLSKLSISGSGVEGGETSPPEHPED